MADATPDQEKIDFEQLTMELEQEMCDVGWIIQNRNEMNLDASSGVAIRDFPGVSAKRDLDYLLFVNGRAVGVAWKARSLLYRGEREIRDASDVRRVNSFPIPFNPLPFIVFQDQSSMQSEWTEKHFRVIRRTGLIGAKSHQDGFPSPDTLSRLLMREKIFRKLGGWGLRWLVRYAFRSKAEQFEVTGGDRERAAKLRKYLLPISILLAVLFLIWLVIGPASIWAMPVSGRSLGTKDFADIRNTTRQVMTAMILGAAAAGGLIFTGRTYRLSLKGQRSDRFSKAVTQLSSKTNSERVGGIFALEQLLRESADQHEAIVDVLSHFVRERASGLSTVEIDSEQMETAQRTLQLEAACQVALTVLGRRPARPESKPLDLSRTNLAGARLSRAMLRGAVLKDTNLRGADLDDADLSDADLTKATLTQASLTGSRMTRAVAVGADFVSASMVGADLTMAVLSSADMQSAQLNGATLRDARMLNVKLTQAHLADADLTGAYLRYANLDEAYLVKAVLRKAFLRGAKMRRTNLAQADLRKAYLRLAIMPDARLPQANLSGAMLHDTNLTRADLSGANLADADLSGTLLNEVDLRGATLEPVAYSLEEVTQKSPGMYEAGHFSLGHIYPPRGLRPNQLFTAKIDSNTTLPPDMQSYLKQKKDSSN